MQRIPLKYSSSNAARKGFKKKKEAKLLVTMTSIGGVFKYNDKNTFSRPLSANIELLAIYRDHFSKFAGISPWNKILKTTFLDNIPSTVWNQKVYWDGTFLREENAMKRCAEGRANSQMYNHEFYQCELLILYLAAIDRISRIQQKEEMRIVGQFLEKNRRSFTGQSRSMHGEKGKERLNKTKDDYNLYFKPIFNQISSLIKRKGSGSI